MKIVVFGIQASGKGTLAKTLSSEYGWPHISIGDILRGNIAKGTKLGKIAEDYVNNGMLVPDDLIFDLLKDRLKKADCKKGYILDGFPRNHKQFEELQKIDQIDLAIYIDIPIKEALKRISYRRICPACTKIYSIRDKVITECDACGTKLIQREDEKPEAVKKRIDTYLSQTKPLIDIYKKQKVLVKVKGQGTPEDTYKEVKKILLTFEKKRK
jgi:adenylate kinase